MKRGRGPVVLALTLLALWSARIPENALAAAGRRMAIAPLIDLDPEATGRWSDPQANRLGYAAMRALRGKLGTVAGLSILEIAWPEWARQYGWWWSRHLREHKIDLVGMGSYIADDKKIVLDFHILDTATRETVYRGSVEGEKSRLADLAGQLGEAAMTPLAKFLGAPKLPPEPEPPVEVPEPPEPTPPVPPEPAPPPPEPMPVPPEPVPPVEVPKPPAPPMPEPTPPEPPIKPPAPSPVERPVEKVLPPVQPREVALDSADAYLDRGNVHKSKGELDRAIDDYTRALELKPGFTKAFSNRGLAYLDQGEYGRAIRDFDRAIQLRSDYARAYHNRGIAYGHQGDYVWAIRDFNTAIQLRPNAPDSYEARAAAFYYRKAYDWAWGDVKACRQRGGKVDPALLEALKRDSGRSE